MNESSIAIRWRWSPNDGTEILVCGEKNSMPYFREEFISIEKPYLVSSVSERETDSEIAQDSATTVLLTNLVEIIQKSNKTKGSIISEQENNSKFPFIDLITIKKFSEITGIEIDESRFRNRKEFQMYFRSLIKEHKGKEDWR